MAEINAAIPLSVNPPAQPTNIMASLGQLMSIRDAASQIALRNQQTLQAQQQTQNIQAEQQQRNRDLADQDTLQKSLTDPDHPEYAKAAGSGDFSFLNGKVQPKSQVAWKASSLDSQQKAALLDKDTLANSAARHQEIEKSLTGLYQMAQDPKQGPAAAAQAYPTMLAHLQGEGYLKDLNPAAIPDSIDGRPETIAQLAAQNGLYQGLYEKALADKKEQTATEESAAAAAASRATAAKSGVETAKEQLSLDAMRKAVADQQAGGAHPIDSVLPASVDKTANAAFKANYDVAMRYGGPEAALKVVSEAAQHAGQIGTETNPAVMQARTNQAVATDRATAPIKVQTAVQTQQALNAGSNAAFSTVPPHLVPTATAAAQKAGTDIVGAINSANEMKQIISEARGGNKVAYAFAPVTGVLTINSANGTKRMNMAEINQYGGAGSVADHVQQWFGTHVTGDRIPEDILKDMEALHGSLEKNSENTYRNAITNVNTNFGSKINPDDLLKNLKGSSTNATTGTIRARDLQGKLHEAPAGTALPTGWKLEQ